MLGANAQPVQTLAVHWPADAAVTAACIWVLIPSFAVR